MYQSLETRWFHRGEPSHEVRSAFEDGARDPIYRERIDAYLLMPEVDTVGVKIREGRFEIKARVGNETHAQLFGRDAIVERWVKWSHSAGDGALLRALITNNAFGSLTERWLLVRKRRLMRIIGLEGDTIVEPPPGVRVESGCGLELTLIHVLIVEPEAVHAQESQPWSEAEPWWTMGFEAFGPRRDQAFEASLGHFEHLVPKHIEFPGSYPRWICDQFASLGPALGS